jgi:hypothetical protein
MTGETIPITIGEKACNEAHKYPGYFADKIREFKRERRLRDPEEVKVSSDLYSKQWNTEVTAWD